MSPFLWAMTAIAPSSNDETHSDRRIGSVVRAIGEPL